MYLDALCNTILSLMQFRRFRARNRIDTWTRHGSLFFGYLSASTVKRGLLLS